MEYNGNQRTGVVGKTADRRARKPVDNGDKKGSERRSAPRVPYKAKATVFFNNNTHTCNIINLSRDGALLTSPVDAEPGNFLRLNLKLPGLDQLIDLDAIMIRQSGERRDSWAVSFCQVSERAGKQLEQYISGILRRHAEKKEKEARTRADRRMRTSQTESISGSKSGSGDWQDWKSLQAAVVQRMKAVTQKVPPVQPAESQSQKAQRKKKDTHEEFEESLGSLDDIYRDALKSLSPGKGKRRPK